MRTVLLDTHALLWLDAEPARLGHDASRIVRGSELVVAAVSWFELALLVRRGRVRTEEPVLNWLTRLARDVRSVPVSPAIAVTAAALGPSFPHDPFDRVIYATAIEHGWQLVTKDRRMHAYPGDRVVAVW